MCGVKVRADLTHPSGCSVTKTQTSPGTPVCHPGTGCACFELCCCVCTVLPAGWGAAAIQMWAAHQLPCRSAGRDPSAGARLQNSNLEIFSNRKLIKLKKKRRKQMSSFPMAAEQITELQTLLKFHCRTEQYYLP